MTLFIPDPVTASTKRFWQLKAKNEILEWCGQAKFLTYKQAKRALSELKIRLDERLLNCMNLHDFEETWRVKCIADHAEVVLVSISDVSKRQDPVVNTLADLLDQAKATAAAISDNAIEEQRSIPIDLLRSFNNDLERIKAHLLTAADVPEKIHTAS